MGKGRENAFENIKNELYASLLLQLYSLTKEATVTTDASEKAIGGVLSQGGYLVIYVSRKLSQAEQNYSNIEREPLAIVFVVIRLKQFLLGGRFTLQSDHKYLFAPDEETPKTGISMNYEMGDSSDGILLRIEIYTRRTDPPR